MVCRTYTFWQDHQERTSKIGKNGVGTTATDFKGTWDIFRESSDAQSELVIVSFNCFLPFHICKEIERGFMFTFHQSIAIGACGPSEAHMMDVDTRALLGSGVL